jgi:hypothetical protein
MQTIHEIARKQMAEASAKQKKQYDHRANPNQYHRGDAVWLHNPARTRGRSPKLQSPWEGPYLVIDVLSDVVYRIQKEPHTKPKVVHHDRLKPCCGEVHNWLKQTAPEVLATIEENEPVDAANTDENEPVKTEDQGSSPGVEPEENAEGVGKRIRSPPRRCKDKSCEPVDTASTDGNEPLKTEDQGSSPGVDPEENAEGGGKRIRRPPRRYRDEC